MVRFEKDRYIIEVYTGCDPVESWLNLHEEIAYLLSGGTDSKHFVSLCPNCLRFTAYRISADQQVRCHAIDENIDLDTIPNGVDFFKNLIQGL